MDLMSLMIRIGADVSGAISGMNEVQGEMKDTEKSASGFSANMKKIGSVLKTAFTAVAIKKVTTGLVNLATKAASTADNIDKMSQKIGISREAYQELDFIMSQSGTSVDVLQNGIKTLTSKMDAFASGNKNAKETFEELGVEVTNSDGTFRSQEEVFYDVVSALQGVDDQTKKARLATELFGRAGSEMMPLLNGASGSIGEMRQQAHDLGLVMNDESIDAGVKFTDTMDQLKRSFGAIVTAVGVDLMPIFQTLSEWVVEHMPEIRSVVSTAFNVIKNVINVVVTFIKDMLIPTFTNIVTYVSETLYPIVSEKWEALQAGLKKVFEAIRSLWLYTLYPVFDTIRTWVVYTLVPALKTAWQGIQTKINDVFTAISSFWTDILQPVFSVLGETVTALWKEIFVPLAEFIGGAFKEAWDDIVKFWAETLQPKIEALKEAFENFKENTLSPIRDWIYDMFLGAWESISSLFDGDLSDSVSSIGEAFATLRDSYLEPVWNWIKDYFLTTIENIETALSSVIDFLTFAFSGDWENAWNAIVTGFGTIFGNMVNLIKSPINAVIKAINWMISAVENAINAVIGGINNKLRIKIDPIKVFGKTVFEGLDWSPDLKKVKWGRIKYLATGGYLADGERAVVGEKRPELLTLVNGGAFVTPLGGTRKSDHLSEGNTYNYTFAIYQQPGENAEELATRIDQILQRREKQRKAAFA